MGTRLYSDLSGLAKLIYLSEKNYLEAEGKKVTEEFSKIISDDKMVRIIRTFKHAFEHKVAFEYAKTCYHLGLLVESETVIQRLAKIVNLDWRTVYKLYYLLSFNSVK